MPIFTKGDSAHLFIHIPKAAGTTVEDAFEASGYTVTYRKGRRAGSPYAHLPCSPQHMHSALLDAEFGDRPFASVFCLVRHPVARFLSEYRWRHKRGGPLTAAGPDAFATEVLRRVADNPYALDNHLRPQSEFVWRNCTVYRLEDGMAAALAAISAALPVPLEAADGHARRSQDAAPPELSPATVAALREVYRADYERFGYE